VIAITACVDEPVDTATEEAATFSDPEPEPDAGPCDPSDPSCGTGCVSNVCVIPGDRYDP
jgi:hypothetical protein